MSRLMGRLQVATAYKNFVWLIVLLFIIAFGAVYDIQTYCAETTDYQCLLTLGVLKRSTDATSRRITRVPCKFDGSWLTIGKYLTPISRSFHDYGRHARKFGFGASSCDPSHIVPWYARLRILWRLLATRCALRGSGQQ